MGKTTATQIVGETNSKQKSWIKTTAMKHTSRNRALEAVLPACCVHNQRIPVTGAWGAQNKNPSLRKDEQYVPLHEENGQWPKRVDE